METSYLSQFDRVAAIEKGMSEDRKYRVEKDGVSCLLRISDGSVYETKKREYEFLRFLNGIGLPVPQCIAFERDPDTDAVYTLLSWISGEEAERILLRASEREQYDLGTQAGGILRKLHDGSAVTDSKEGWYDRYFSVMEPRLCAFEEKGDRFDGCDKILRCIHDNRHLLKTRPMRRHHGDYHTGNMIVRAGKLSVIDWHTVDFENVGDPWYEFNRIAAEHPQFAKGQIDGYFGNAVPHEFWKLFALYLSASAITSIVWAKHRAPQEYDSIMELNRRVLLLFDGMENPVPQWYRGMR